MFCLQPFADQSQQRPISNSLLQHLQQLVVLKVVKEPFNVGFHHEVMLSPVQLVRQFPNRIVRAASWPIPVAARQKVRLVRQSGGTLTLSYRSASPSALCPHLSDLVCQPFAAPAPAAQISLPAHLRIPRISRLAESRKVQKKNELSFGLTQTLCSAF